MNYGLHSYIVYIYIYTDVSPHEEVILFGAGCVEALMSKWTEKDPGELMDLHAYLKEEALPCQIFFPCYIKFFCCLSL